MLYSFYKYKYSVQYRYVVLSVSASKGRNHSRTVTLLALAEHQFVSGPVYLLGTLHSPRHPELLTGSVYLLEEVKLCVVEVWIQWTGELPVVYLND